jgi:hypothetical protein
MATRKKKSTSKRVGKYPKTWKQVFELPGLDTVADHSGGTNGERPDENASPKEWKRFREKLARRKGNNRKGRTGKPKKNVSRKKRTAVKSKRRSAKANGKKRNPVAASRVKSRVRSTRNSVRKARKKKR